MARKHRIPELVVGKIYFDNGKGDGSTVYTFQVDDNDSGKLKIKNNKNKDIAHIDQATGEINAVRFKGDGSDLDGVAASGLADLQKAKLLTLTSDGMFFRFTEGGSVENNQSITLSVSLQNADSQIVTWSYIDSNSVKQFIPTGNDSTVLTLSGADFAAFGDDTLTITAEADGGDIFDTLTIFALRPGASGTSAFAVIMENETVTLRVEDINGYDSIDLNNSAAKFTVFFGLDELTPTTDTPSEGEFSVTIPSNGEEFVVAGEPTVSGNKIIYTPSNLTADAAAITYDINIRPAGSDSITTLQRVQSFVLTRDGATGKDSKTVILSSNDLQIGYDEQGGNPDPASITLTGLAKNHSGSVEYRFSKRENVDGDLGDWQYMGDSPYWQTGADFVVPSGFIPDTYDPTGIRKLVRVETREASDANTIVADDIQGIIFTKAGSPNLLITGDNLTHAYASDENGTVQDIADGRCIFDAYIGNTRLSFDGTISGLFDHGAHGSVLTELESGLTLQPNWDDGLTYEEKIKILVNEQGIANNSYVVFAEPINADVPDENDILQSVDSIVIGSAVTTTGDDVTMGTSKFTPTYFDDYLDRASVVYTFVAKNNMGQMIGPITQTQTFSKARKGQQGDSIKGQDSKTVKVLSSDYQVAFDADGSNPVVLSPGEHFEPGTVRVGAGATIIQAADEDTTNRDIVLTIREQNHRTNYLFYRVKIQEGDVVETLESPTTQYVPENAGNDEDSDGDEDEYLTTVPWGGSDGWIKPSLSQKANQEVKIALPSSFIEDTYDQFPKKKVIVETAERLDTSEINWPSEAVGSFDWSTLAVIAADEIAIIATKDGSNAVEITADNLAHVFPADEFGDIQTVPNDYEGGKISFDVYIGNDQLVPYYGAGSLSESQFKVTALTSTNITAGAPVASNNVSFEFAAPTAFDINERAASIKFQIDLKDASGTVRGPFYRTQTLGKTTDGSTARTIMLTTDANAYQTPDKESYTLTVDSVTVLVKQNNSDSSISEGDITIKDVNDNILKWSEQSGSRIFDSGGSYNTPEELTQTTSGQVITSQFTIDFSDLAHNMFVDNRYIVTPFNEAKALFPLTIEVSKAGEGSDKTSVYMLVGGSDAINVMVPNNNHTFAANSDGELFSEDDLDDGGSQVEVYHGATPLAFNASPAAEDTGLYYFGTPVYSSAGASIDAVDSLVGLDLSSGNIVISSVNNSKKNTTITLPVIVRRSNSTEEETHNTVLSYTKASDGSDGINGARQNYDFSYGITGWSYSYGVEDGVEIPETDYDIISDTIPLVPDGSSKEALEYISSRTNTHGVGSGYFKNEDTDDRIVWTKYAIPYPSSLNGGFKIKFRAKANDGNSGATGKTFSNTDTFAQLFIRGYNVEGGTYNPLGNDAEGDVIVSSQGTTYDPNQTPQICSIKFPAASANARELDEENSLSFESGGGPEANYGAADLLLVNQPMPGAQPSSVTGEGDTYIPLREGIYDEYEFTFGADVLNKYFADVAALKMGFRVFQMNSVNDHLGDDGIVIDNFSIEFVEEYTTMLMPMFVPTANFELISNGSFQNEDNGLPSDVVFGIWEKFNVSESEIDSLSDGALRNEYDKQKSKTTKALKKRKFPLKHRGKEIFTKVGSGVDNSPVLRFRDGGHPNIEYETWSNAFNSVITESIDDVYPRYAAVFKKVTLPTESKKIRVHFRYKIEQTSGEIDAKGPKLFLWFAAGAGGKYITSPSSKWRWTKDSAGNSTNVTHGSEYGSGVYIKVDLKYGNTWYEEAIDIDPATGKWYYLHHDGTESGAQDINNWTASNGIISYNNTTGKEFSVNIYSAQDTDNGNNTGDLHIDYVKAEIIEPESLGDWDPDAADAANQGASAFGGLVGSSMREENDGTFTFLFDSDDIDDVPSGFSANNANAFDVGTPGEQVKDRADSGAGASTMIDGATFDVNSDGTMTFSFGADTVNGVDVGSTPTLSPTTIVSNNAISISNGMLQGIGLGAGTPVDNQGISVDGDGKIQGIGSGAGTSVNNLGISIDADGELVGIGTTGTKVSNNAISISNGMLQGIGSGAGTTIANNAISISGGQLQGIGSGAGTTIANNAITIGNDGALSGIGTAGIKVNNENAFDDGVGLDVKNDANDGKTAHTGLVNGSFTEDDGFLKFDLGTMGTKTSPHPTDIRKTGKNNFIASSGITMIGTTAQKTSGGSDWNEQLVSKDGFVGGAYASATRGSGNFMFGLNTNPQDSAHYNTIDYAWYSYSDTQLSMWENGSSKGTVVCSYGDVLSITYDGHSIRYMVNGEVKRTAEVSITSKLFFDSSFYNEVAKLENIDFGPMSDTSKGHEVRGFFGDEATPLIKVTNAPTDLKNANAFDGGIGLTVKNTAEQGVSDAATAQGTADTAKDTADTAKDTADAASEGVQLVKNTQEDMTVQSSAAVNGRFSVLDDAGKAPAGISLLNFGDGTNVGGYTRENQTSWEVESNNTDGQYLRMKGANNRRRGILLPFASIPENHFVEVTIKYKGGDSNQTAEKPLWRVYSTSDEVDQEEYTHLFPDNNEWYAEDGAKIYKHANVDWQGEKFDEKTSWTTLTFKAGFDWEDNPPKYCSIALMTAWSTGSNNNKDLLIKYIDVTFKKASYRSGQTYPTDIVAQKGDQFFQITTANDYGYLSTYGKAVYDFGVTAVLPSNYAWSSADGWPYNISSKWTRSNDSDSYKATVQPIEVIDSYDFNSQTFTYRTEYYLSTTSYGNRYAYIKRKFFGPHKIIMHYIPIHRKSDGKVIMGSSAIDVMFDHTNSNNQFSTSATTTTVDTTIRTKLDGGSWTDRKTASKNTYDTDDGGVQTLTYENTDNTKSFEISLKLDGYGNNGGCFAVKKLEVITFSPTVDERTETGLYELAEDLNGSITTFTGQHKCVLTGSSENIDGLIVSSTGKYDNMNYRSHEHRFKVNPQEAVPVVCKTDTEKDKKVLGVVNGIWHKAAFNTRFLTDGLKEDYTPRYEINSLGEGGIWVSNIAGDLENGDYICSSNIPGYGMKQDDDILRNYTVAKITQDCTFDLDSEDYDCKEVEHDGTIYKVAFVGCTYHCG